jgi:hypothetical protein
MDNDNMEDGLINSKENISKMFAAKNRSLSTDEQLALEIFHRFNICEDTLETMPAFEEHLELLFLKERKK